jgi:hypothetical protein
MGALYFVPLGQDSGHDWEGKQDGSEDDDCSDTVEPYLQSAAGFKRDEGPEAYEKAYR